MAYQFLCNNKARDNLKLIPLEKFLLFESGTNIYPNTGSCRSPYGADQIWKNQRLLVLAAHFTYINLLRILETLNRSKPLIEILFAKSVRVCMPSCIRTEMITSPVGVGGVWDWFGHGHTRLQDDGTILETCVSAHQSPSPPEQQLLAGDLIDCCSPQEARLLSTLISARRHEIGQY